MKTRYGFDAFLWTMGWFLVFATCIDAQEHGAARKPDKTVVPGPTLSVSVLSFRQTVGTSEMATLGVGAGDSISNALKSVANLVVTDGDIVSQAAAKSDPALDLSKDDEALMVGSQLNLQFIVTGSYQSIGSQLLFDARILNVVSGRALPGVILRANGKFPDEYSAILQQLTNKILAGLRIRVSDNERGNVNGSLNASKSADAQNAYIRAGQRIRDGTQEALAEAIILLDRCLADDPSFAPAYVAKADAEVELLEMRKRKGSSSPQLEDDALRDAQAAATRMPGLSHSHRTLARAFNAVGSYGAAKTAAERAVQISPNDLTALLALARAVGQGQIARIPASERAFRLQPGLAFILADLPKVRVVNQSGVDVGVTFKPGDNQPAYPASRISPNGSKIVALLSGKYDVTVESEIGDLAKGYDFEAGKDYTLTFQASEFPTATAVVRNVGSLIGYVTFQGPKPRTVAIAPGTSEDVLISPGQYTITIAATAGGPPLRTSYESLRPGSRLALEFGITQRIVQRP